MTLLCLSVSPYMVYLHVINSCYFKRKNVLNPDSLVMFCNIIDCDVFVNISTLKCPSWIVNGIFAKIVLKIKMK